MSLRYYLECKYLISPEMAYSVEEVANEVISVLNAKKENYIDVTGFAKDYYLSSSLIDDQKDSFYSILKAAGFFQQVNTSLYSGNFSICSWSIYVLGKFSNGENAVFLETAYETYFLKNPMLAYRCLSELDWLNSEKTGGYLSALNDERSIISKLILLYYWEIRGGDPTYKNLLADKELLEFIAPGVVLVDLDEISMSLFQFENHISGIYDSEGLDSISMEQFESMAKDYFKTYPRVTDGDPDKEYEQFLKNLGSTLFRLN
jgi:hypothetical protein